ncbi:MAG: signal recognition particle-docking protein FtsY [Bacteroides sp.]|nr:MAG: signal recognition particle-docking protein FtsY [Bacteroides sp.]
MFLQKIFNKINNFIIGNNFDKNKLLDDIEIMLVQSDISVNTTMKIINIIESKINDIAPNKLSNKYVYNLLKDIIYNILSNNEYIKKQYNDNLLHVILMVGANGTGKTTTVAKIAHIIRKNNEKVILGAADTFRAAAIDQLKIWANRVNVPIVYNAIGTDPASIVYETIQLAISNKLHFAIIDTSGRLHNKSYLMKELIKINKIIKHKFINITSENILILDSNNGQNSINQVREFSKSINIDGIIMTKMDNISKGGTLISIKDNFDIPIQYVCNGEKLNDISLFNKNIFINNLINA